MYTARGPEKHRRLRGSAWSDQCEMEFACVPLRAVEWANRTGRSEKPVGSTEQTSRLDAKNVSPKTLFAALIGDSYSVESEESSN